MTQTTHPFSFVIFRCGCAHRTIVDAAIACPVHGKILVENRTIRFRNTETPDLPGLVMNQYLTNVPHVLRNSGSNSRRSLVSVRGVRGHEWEKVASSWPTPGSVEHGGKVLAFGLSGAGKTHAV